MNKKKFTKLLALYLPYLVIGLAATNLGESWRLAEGKELGDKIVSLIDTLPAAFANPLPSLHPLDILVGICCGAGLRLAVYLKSKNAKKYRHGMEYGSARWGTPADIAPFMAPKFEDNIILTKTERLMMSNRPPDPKNARNKNVLVVGGSGSGKTRYFIKPNLLQCTSKSHPVSFVVTDPKGGLIQECGLALLKNGYKIRTMNTINFHKSMRYNPFAYIHEEKDILKLVTTLMTNTKGEGQGGDPFWDKAERLLLTSLIAYLHYEAPAEEQNFATLLEMLNTMQVSEEDEDYQNPVDLLFEDLAKKKPNSFAGRQYKLYKLAAGKTAKSILISCGARLSPFDIQEIRDATMYDELELDKLGDRKTALFLIMSDTDSTFNFLISMIYSQLFNLLCDKADDVYGGKLPVHVRCLIDECANIGQIPQLEKLVATIRSREISACLVLQTRSQLKAIYKDNADTIVGNMDSQIFLGGSEPTTLKDLAEALGKETIDSYNNSDTRGNSPSYGTNYQKLGHELMSRDELAVLDGGKCICQCDNTFPGHISRHIIRNTHPIDEYPVPGMVGNIKPKILSIILNRTVNPADFFASYDKRHLRWVPTQFHRSSGYQLKASARQTSGQPRQSPPHTGRGRFRVGVVVHFRALLPAPLICLSQSVRVPDCSIHCDEISKNRNQDHPYKEGFAVLPDLHIVFRRIVTNAVHDLRKPHIFVHAECQDTEQHHFFDAHRMFSILFAQNVDILRPQVHEIKMVDRKRHERQQHIQQ